MIDPECFDLTLPVLANHVHELLTRVLFSQLLPVGVTLYQLLEGFFIGEKTLPTLDNEGCRVGNEVIEEISVF